MNKPQINKVTISPQTAIQKQQITITVDVEDKPIVYQKVTYYAGQDIRSGQQIGVM